VSSWEESFSERLFLAAPLTLPARIAEVVHPAFFDADDCSSSTCLYNPLSTGITTRFPKAYLSVALNYRASATATKSDLTTFVLGNAKWVNHCDWETESSPSMRRPVSVKSVLQLPLIVEWSS
jgi:hypothetical protein